MKQLIQLNEPIGEVNKPTELFKKIKRINIDYKQENLIVFYLNAKNQVINKEILFKGGLDACLIDPKTLFRKALLKNALSVIICHNHPSSNLNPSTGDLEVYKRLKDAGKMLSICVLDSIIFNKKEFYSLNGGGENA